MKMLSVISLVAVLGGVVGCRGPKAGEISIRDWWLSGPNGECIKCELGTLYVPENRSKANSRLIGIGFLRIKKEGPQSASVPPTIHLPGGPGISYLDKLGARFPLQPLKKEHYVELEFYRSISDVIYFDQRGFSEGRGEVLRHRYWTKEYPLDQPASIDRQKLDFIELSKDVVKSYERTGVDLAGYTVKECAADVKDLCKALKYDRATLVGHSFGGQWTFATIRLYPEIVARAIIAGGAPLGHTYTLPSHQYAALERFWEWWLEKNPEYVHDLPPHGLAGALDEIIRRLEKGSLRVTVMENNTKHEIVLGRDDFNVVDHFFDSQPHKLLDVYHGCYAEWAEHVVQGRRRRLEEMDVLDQLIETSLAATESWRQAYYGDRKEKTVRRPHVEFQMATEKIWPTPDVGDDFRTEKVTTVSVLFVQGTLDQKTPMENLQDLGQYFKSSRTITVVDGAHGAYAAALRNCPAVKAGVEEFLRTGSFAKVPLTVGPGPRGCD